MFVVGALDETLILRGMRYHPIDIENSVLRAHKKIAEWWVINSLHLPPSHVHPVLTPAPSAVFTWTNLLVVVAELDGGENEALDLVPLVTNVVLEVTLLDNQHKLPFGRSSFLYLYHTYQYIFYVTLEHPYIPPGAPAYCGHCSHCRPWHRAHQLKV